MLTEPIEGVASVDANGGLSISLNDGDGPLADLAAVWAPAKGCKVRMMSTSNRVKGWVLLEYDVEAAKG